MSTTELATPVPEWATASIFLSPDLLISIFAALDVEDSAVPQSCKLWHQCWLDSDDFRRGLRADSKCTLHQPEFEHGVHVERIIAPPCGAWFCLLVEMQDPNFEEAPLCAVYMADASMSHVRDMHKLVSHGVVRGCATKEKLYMSVKSRVSSYSASVAHQLQGLANLTVPTQAFAEMALAPAGTLFVAAYDRWGGVGEDEVCALDPSTLAIRYKFGRGMFPCHIQGLAVDDECVYVGDDATSNIFVFDLAGERLREIRGSWSIPSELCYFDGRLYLLEDWRVGSSTSDGGKRILTLKTSGKQLGVWESGGHAARSIVVAGRRLVVTLHAKNGHSSGSRLRVEPTKLVALKGI